MDKKITIQISMSLDEAWWLSELLIVEEDFPWTHFFGRVRGVALRAIKRHDMTDEELFDEKIKKIKWEDSKFKDYAFRAMKGKLKKAEEKEWVYICYKYKNVEEFSDICEEQRKRAIRELNPFE